MTEEWDLTVEWLRSLKVVKEAGFTAAVPMLAHQVSVEWAEKELLPCARIIYKPNDVPSRRVVRVQVNPALTYITDYEVERLEILLYIAGESLAYLLGWGAPELGAYCMKVGCANTRLMTPRERWRRIGVELDPRDKTGSRVASLVSTMFEDRPLCGWCKSPIPTLSASPSRKDLHEGCHDYVRRVVRPQILRERELRKAQHG